MWRSVWNQDGFIEILIFLCNIVVLCVSWIRTPFQIPAKKRDTKAH